MKALFKAQSGPLAVVRFFLVFALSFLVLQQVYLATRSFTDPWLSHRLNASVSAAIINLITPHADALANAGTVQSTLANIDIRKGCEGIEVVLLFVAAMLGYPMGARRRWPGLVFGVLFIYLANLLRIISLFYVIAYRREWFDTAHVGIGQTVMIILAFGFFLWWIEPKRESADVG